MFLIDNYYELYNNFSYLGDYYNYDLNKFNIKCLKYRLDNNGKFICNEYGNKKNKKCEKLPCLY